jgi:hypothetical protein
MAATHWKHASPIRSASSSGAELRTFAPADPSQHPRSARGADYTRIKHVMSYIGS